MAEKGGSGSQGYGRPELLVDCAWVEAHMGDEDVRVVDCRSEEAYQRGHIPGAAWVGVQDALPGNAIGPWVKDPSSPARVMPPMAFADLTQRLGIADETTVVVYSGVDAPPGATLPRDVPLMFSTRLWWVLTYYGHRNVKVLDGGWAAWAAQGRRVDVTEPRTGGAAFRPHTDPSMVCHVEELITRHKEAGVQVVSTLPYPVYAGEVAAPGNGRAGRIPGSINLDPSAFVNDAGTFRTAAEIVAALQSAGVDPDKDVIVHCQAGVRSTVALFAMALVGYGRARLYEGSMFEWANRDDTPLETSAPR